MVSDKHLWSDYSDFVDFDGCQVTDEKYQCNVTLSSNVMKDKAAELMACTTFPKLNQNAR